MSQEITIQEPIFHPTTFEKFSDMAIKLSKSDLVPAKDYKGKPENILIAMQMGYEVGLKPMQAIQNIAVINGRPSIWGDAAIALVQSNPLCESIHESPITKGSEVIGYRCKVKRVGQ